MSKVSKVAEDFNAMKQQQVLNDEVHAQEVLMSFAKHYALVKNITLYFAVREITILAQRQLCGEFEIEVGGYDEI